MIQPPQTLRDLLENAVLAEPRDHVFTRFYENDAWQTRTYAETLERVRTLSEWFGAHGLQPRKTRIALILPNSPLWQELDLAIVGIAGTVVPMDPKLTPAEMHHILSDSEACMIVTDAAHLKPLIPILPTLPEVREVLLAGDTIPEGLAIPATTVTQALDALDPDVPLRFWDDPAYRPTGEDISGILYTSGTTGRPKGAMLSHRNFVTDAIGTLEVLGNIATSEDNFLVVLPLFHAFSFTANFVLSMLVHCRLSFIRSLRTVSDDLQILQPTVFMMVPLMAEKLYARMMEAVKESFMGRLCHCLLPKVIGKRIAAGFGGKLRLGVVGGAKADQALLRDLWRMGVPILEGYGLTECAPVVSINPPHKMRPGTIGPAVGGCECRIANPNEQGVGELQVRGPINFPGYWKNPEATDAIYDGEWLRTGDLATMDSEGYLAIRGRAKALIVNREGKNIYPEEVEQAIAREPLIGAVLVLAYSTKGEPGEKVGALVSANPDTVKKLLPNATEEEVETALRDAVKRAVDALANYKHPRKVVVSPTPLERTSTSKVRRGVYAGTLDE